MSKSYLLSIVRVASYFAMVRVPDLHQYGYYVISASSWQDLQVAPRPEFTPCDQAIKLVS